MNILFTRFPLESSLNGGLENQTMCLMAELKKRGHEVEFLGSCRALIKRTEELRIKNYELRIGPPPVTKWSAASFLWRRKTMQKRLIQTLIKLTAHSSQLTAIFMLSLSEKILLTDFAAKNGIKVFWIEHDRIGNWLKWNPWLKALKKASENATIICVSDLSKRLYEGLGFDAGKITVIPNGVPRASPSSFSKLTAQSSQLHLGCISRLSPEKGIDVLIQAVQTQPEVSLSIVGSGPEEGYIRRLIDEDTERLGTNQPRIRLLTEVENIEKFYETIDALVLPSVDNDPFGLVAAEAMMRGIPVIVTDACGIASYLRNGVDAIIVPAGSSSVLGSAMKSLSDPSLKEKLSRHGREKAEREFAVEKMVGRYERLLIIGDLKFS